MMNPFQELASALRERLAAIGDREARADPAAHLERIKAASEKITEVQGRLPEKIDPRLRHFLERCSYDKALEMLESPAYLE
jgi:hypothetical protein